MTQHIIVTTWISHGRVLEADFCAATRQRVSSIRPIELSPDTDRAQLYLGSVCVAVGWPEGEV